MWEMLSSASKLNTKERDGDRERVHFFLIEFMGVTLGELIFLM